MEDFELPVTFKGKELLFPAHLAQLGYTYKVMVQVEHGQVVFEPDEERNWRAVASEDLLGSGSRNMPPAELVAAMAESLQQIFS
jgi:hypothetical protein